MNKSLVQNRVRIYVDRLRDLKNIFRVPHSQRVPVLVQEPVPVPEPYLRYRCWYQSEKLASLYLVQILSHPITLLLE